MGSRKVDTLIFYLFNYFVESNNRIIDTWESKWFNSCIEARVWDSFVYNTSDPDSIFA